MDDDLLYALRDPRDGAIRYIGITNEPGKRLRRHRGECRSENHYRGRWWRKVFSETGIEPTMHILLRCNGLDWRAVEPFFIVSGRHFGLRLTNSCNGGEGSRGRKHSPETKARMSALAKNRPPTNTGRRFSQEVKARMSAAAQARGISAEHREKIAASLRSMSDEARALMRARMSAAHKGRPHPPMSDETRAKISAARKGKALPTGHRESISAGLPAFNATKKGRPQP